MTRAQRLEAAFDAAAERFAKTASYTTSLEWIAFEAGWDAAIKAMKNEETKHAAA